MTLLIRATGVESSKRLKFSFIWLKANQYEADGMRSAVFELKLKLYRLEARSTNLSWIEADVILLNLMNRSITRSGLIYVCAENLVVESLLLFIE